MEDLCFAVTQPEQYCRLRAELDRLWNLPTLKIVEEESSAGVSAAAAAARPPTAATAAEQAASLFQGLLPLKAAAVARAMHRALLRDRLHASGSGSGSAGSLDNDDCARSLDGVCLGSFDGDSMFDGDYAPAGAGGAADGGHGGGGGGRYSAELRMRLQSSGTAGPGPSSTAGAAMSAPAGRASASVAVAEAPPAHVDQQQQQRGTSSRATSSVAEASYSDESAPALDPLLSPPTPSSSSSSSGLTAQQLRLEALLSTVVPFDSVNFKSSKALSASARRGLDVSVCCGPAQGEA
jgi:hypothetical protein